MANRYKVNVAISAPNKLKQLCPAIQREKERSRKRKGCGTEHRNKLVACRKGVVYKIPLSCGAQYIGQTGRCLNKRLQEHKNNLENDKELSYLVSHCKKCEVMKKKKKKCTAIWRSTKVLYTHSEQTTRELMEAFYISQEASCVSKPSVILCDKEIAFLGGI